MRFKKKKTLLTSKIFVVQIKQLQKNKWLFKVLEVKNSKKSLKFDQFAKKQVKKYFFYIWTSKKIVVQIKQLQKKISDYSKFQKQKTPKNPCNSTNSRKNNKFYNVAPQIFVYESGNRYECVALSELVRMQCVDFFICDWLKRYRQNTTENWPIWGSTNEQNPGNSWKNEEF